MAIRIGGYQPLFTPMKVLPPRRSPVHRACAAGLAVACGLSLGGCAAGPDRPAESSASGLHAPPAPHGRAVAPVAPVAPVDDASRTWAGSVAARCAQWLDAQAAGQGRLYRVDAAASRLQLLAFRAGRLAAMGHNHVLGVERPAGVAFVPGQGIASAGVALAFRWEDVAIDRAEWRAGLGAEFASTPSASDIEGTRANLLRAMNAATHPVVALESVGAAGAWPRLVLRAVVTLNGQQRELDVAVEARRPADGEALRALGRLVVRQSDFGLTPFSVLGGLLAVQDEVFGEFDLVARPASHCAGLSPAGGGSSDPWRRSVRRPAGSRAADGRGG